MAVYDGLSFARRADGSVAIRIAHKDVGGHVDEVKEYVLSAAAFVNEVANLASAPKGVAKGTLRQLFGVE